MQHHALSLLRFKSFMISFSTQVSFLHRFDRCTLVMTASLCLLLEASATTLVPDLTINDVPSHFGHERGFSQASQTKTLTVLLTSGGARHTYTIDCFQRALGEDLIIFSSFISCPRFLLSISFVVDATAMADDAKLRANLCELQLLLLEQSIQSSPVQAPRDLVSEDIPRQSSLTWTWKVSYKGVTRRFSIDASRTCKQVLEQVLTQVRVPLVQPFRSRFNLDHL
jgi:hypothetical protein